MSTVSINTGVNTGFNTSPAPLRLTRRGRLVVTLLLLGLMLALFTVFSGYSAATGEAGSSPDPHGRRRRGRHPVGDRLGGRGAGETREVVHEIQELNSLPGPELVEGQELAVPVG